MLINEPIQFSSLEFNLSSVCLSGNVSVSVQGKKLYHSHTIDICIYIANVMRNFKVAGYISSWILKGPSDYIFNNSWKTFHRYMNNMYEI